MHMLPDGQSKKHRNVPLSPSHAFSATPSDCFSVDDVQNNAEANSSEAQEHQLTEVPLKQVKLQKAYLGLSCA